RTSMIDRPGSVDRSASRVLDMASVDLAGWSVRFVMSSPWGDQCGITKSPCFSAGVWSVIADDRMSARSAPPLHDARTTAMGHVVVQSNAHRRRMVPQDEDGRNRPSGMGPG